MTRQGPVIHEYSTSSVISEKLRILVLFDNYYTLLYIDNYTYIITFIRKWLVYVNFHPLFAIDPWHNLWYLCIITVQNLEITCVIWVLWKLFACCNNLLIAFWSRCHISLVAFVTLLNLTTKTIASLQLIKKLTGICVTVIPSSILNPWQYFLLVTFSAWIFSTKNYQIVSKIGALDGAALSSSGCLFRSSFKIMCKAFSSISSLCIY